MNDGLYCWSTYGFHLSHLGAPQLIGRRRHVRIKMVNAMICIIDGNKSQISAIWVSGWISRLSTDVEQKTACCKNNSLNHEFCYFWPIKCQQRLEIDEKSADRRLLRWQEIGTTDWTNDAEMSIINRHNIVSHGISRHTTSHIRRIVKRKGQLEGF